MADDNLLEGIDFSLPLHTALVVLNGKPAQEENVFPKPSTLCRKADMEEDQPPITVIIDEIIAKFSNYPELVTILMKRRFLKKKQQCRRCNREMSLRRRKGSYEWRCRSKTTKRDCSSCSIKAGSWFEKVKVSFDTIFNFLIMNGKNCSTDHMVNHLGLSSHAVNEIRKMSYDLTENIIKKYKKIGGDNKEVFVEVVTVIPNKPNGQIHVFKVVAGVELETKRCFARIVPDERPATIEQTIKDHVAEDSLVTMVTTISNNVECYDSQNVKYLDERVLRSPDELPTDLLFSNIRNAPIEFIRSTAELFQMYLNDQVVRRQEGKFFLEGCFNELRKYF
ncbi:unnamed protein product [Caenorhabditis sp. 36 PRJEB53466]|nr:unnamed protein product [Caenorhabditis sp. 36 PRJEB53466]